MEAGLTYDQVMSLGKGAEPPHEGSTLDEGLTYEQVMALGNDKSEPDNGYALSGLKGGVAKVKTALQNEPVLSNLGLPGRLASAGLGALTEKYADPLAEGWYSRSAARSAGGWIAERLAALLPGGADAVVGLRKKSSEASDQSIPQMVAETLGFMVNNPGQAATELAKDTAANPELLAVGSLGAVQKAAHLAELAKLGTAGKYAAMGAASMGEGAAVMGGMDVALQLQNENIDWKKAASTAATGAALVPAVHLGVAGLERLRNGPKDVTPSVPPEEPPPPAPGPIDFERKLDSSEAGVKTKAGKVKRAGQPYDSTRVDTEATAPLTRETVYGTDLGVFPEGKDPNFRDSTNYEGLSPAEILADIRSRRIQDFVEGKSEGPVRYDSLNKPEPRLEEPLLPHPGPVDFEKGLKVPFTPEQAFKDAETQPGLNPAEFLAESRAQSLTNRIKAERQSQVNSGFRDKEAEMDKAWQEHKAAQAREAELAAREDQYSDVQDRFDRNRVVNQKGEIDQDLLNKMGLAAAGTVAGLYAYSRPDQQKEIAASVAAIGGVIASRGKLSPEVLSRMSERALGPVLAEGKYTLKTLDRLPQNRTEFNVEQVRQELNKPGTPAAEKAVLEPILLAASAKSGGRVSAVDLVSEFRKATGEHTLTPHVTNKFADHGLPNLGRPDGYEGAKTIVWQFPESMHVSTQNHFGDPRYYGHTREYRADSIDHVVEVQSDLAQNVRKPLTDEARKAAYEELKGLETSPKRPKSDLTAEQEKRWQDLRMSLIKDDTSRVVAGGRPGLKTGEYDFAPLTSVVKNAPNRLIREKLGEAAAKGDESVRFATADTVAKVERWNTESFLRAGMVKQIERDFDAIKSDLTASLADNLKVLRDPKSSDYAKETARITVDFAKESLAAWRAKIETAKTRPFTVEEKSSITPGHQSLYDRYSKETTSYLKSLGGKEVTDAKGNTWLEVPTGAKLEGPDVWDAVDRLKVVDATLKELRNKPNTTGSTKEFYAREKAIENAQAEKMVLLDQIHEAEAATKIVSANPDSASPRPFGGRTDSTGQGPIHMYGKADPDLLLKLGLGSAGALTGAYLAGDEKIAGIALGTVAALSSPAAIRAVSRSFSPQHAFSQAARVGLALGAGTYLGNKIEHPVEGALLAMGLLWGRKMLPEVRKNIGDSFMNLRNGNIQVQENLLHNVKRAGEQMVPDKARREVVTEMALEKRNAGWTPEEHRLMDTYDRLFRGIGNEAVDAGVLQTMRENYITSIVERTPDVTDLSLKKLVNDLFNVGKETNPVGSGKRFTLERKYDTWQELNKALEGSGLRLKTKDITEIFDLYARAMRKSIEDRIMTDSIKNSVDPDGNPNAVRANRRGELPAGYEKIDSPFFRGYGKQQAWGVRSDIAPALKVLLEHQEPWLVTKALLSVSQAIKRSAVFASLFHAKSLAEVYMMSMGRDILNPRQTINQSIARFRDESLKETTDALLRNGLRLGIPEDVSQTVIGSMGKLVDAKTGTTYGTAVTDKIDTVNKHLDRVTWDYMHTGVKASIALKEFERLTLNNAELHSKDPARYPLKSVDQIASEVARFTNDAGGSLDMFRIATEAKTELGRAVATAFASETGRRVAQIIAFAPDWAISTLRAGFKSFGESETGFRGLLKPTNATDLYRRYALRSAAYWITALNAAQYAMTGKPIWENKDPTRLEFGDGTSIQLGKHSAEGVHAVKDPVGFALNKLGFLPRAAVDVAYAHVGKGPLMQQGPGAYVAERVLPFTGRALVDPNLTLPQRAGRAVAGAAGAPIYGYSPEQKLAMRAKTLQQHYDRQMKGH